MTAFDVGPFQRIVNVGWPSARRILAIYIFGGVGASGNGSLPATFTLSAPVTIGGHTTNFGDASAVVLARSGTTPPAPPISQQVTAAMLKYYAEWGYTPWIDLGPVSESKGGGFYFIQTNFGTFPDFVFSPYASRADALSYLNAQLAIHPEYAGGTGTIDFLPAFDDFTQSISFGFLAFINLDAFTPDGNGDYSIPFSVAASSGWSGNITFDAVLLRAPLVGLNLVADDHNQPNFNFLIESDFYQYSTGSGGFNDTPQGGVLVVHTRDDTLTGPASPGGGGGGE